jgi:hypothetical protein
VSTATGFVNLTYNEKVREAHAIACRKNGEGVGASAAETTQVMRDRGWLSELDTVIDIADILRDLGIAK